MYQKKQRVDLAPAAKQAFSKFGFEPTEKQGRYKRFGTLYKAFQVNDLSYYREITQRIYIILWETEDI